MHQSKPLSKIIINDDKLENFQLQTNPIIRQQTVNRLFAGNNQSLKFYNYQNNVDPTEIFSDFCALTNSKKSIEDLLHYIHIIATEKLGYNFIALGLANTGSNYIKIRFIDPIGNAYSSRIMLNDIQNPIVDSFINKTVTNINDINFVNVPYWINSPGTIFPLVSQDSCIGVLIAGSSSHCPLNHDIINILANYLTLLIINNQLKEKTNQDANIDSLTGLNKHRYFQEKLSIEMQNSRLTGNPVSVIMFDINNISQINRAYGHAKGDEIVRLLAEKIKYNIRSIDIAGRYGGDEIAVILPSTTNEEACYLAEYLNYTISCAPDDDIGSIKVSIGVSTFPTCANDQEKLLLLAEQAMLISKSKGYQNGMSTIVSAQDIDFWNEMALNSLATVIARRHSQWGINYEDELVKKFHSESLSSNKNTIDVVTSLAGAIDAKDPYTRGHSQSVQKYAEALARKINLPESEIERIKLGAILHDVGKIGIPESILSKQGSLTDQEWDIMKQHPNIGSKKVLEPIYSLKDLIPIVAHHHEYWNGKGYPDNLKGEDIPLGARIVAIADAFHALISDRPYRKGLGFDEAIKILEEGAGTQWDGDLVKTFLIIAPSLCF